MVPSKIYISVFGRIYKQYNFEQDELPPSAVILEYVHDMVRLDLESFTQERLDRIHKILFEFLEAGLLHGDVFPRNMMVVPSSPDGRVLWIDFDCAQRITRGQSKDLDSLIDEDAELMNDFAMRLVGPHPLVQLNH